jgi:hypothetical protein
MRTFKEWLLHEERHDPRCAVGMQILLPRSACSYDYKMILDVLALIWQHSQEELPLVSLFLSILTGDDLPTLQRQYGRVNVELGLIVLMRLLDKYAWDTGSLEALRLLARVRNPG